MVARMTSPPGITEVLEQFPPPVQAIAQAVRRLVRTTLPRITEKPDRSARIIGYSYGSGYRGMVATIILSRGGVKLGLVRGSEIPDPAGLLAGSGKVHRYIAFADLREVNRPPVKALLRRALAAWRKRTGPLAPNKRLKLTARVDAA